jgi:hypothetical protein
MSRQYKAINHQLYTKFSYIQNSIGCHFRVVFGILRYREGGLQTPGEMVKRRLERQHFYVLD